MAWFETGKNFVTQAGVARRVVLEPNGVGVTLVFFERIQEGRFNAQRLMGVSIQTFENLDGLSTWQEWGFRTVWYPATFINRWVLKNDAIEPLGLDASLLCLPRVSGETVVVVEAFGNV